ncbi:MAG TPA: winged helix-turn-helix transcriptional regulator [Pirellulaceae bacterium]|nr:winged helix-turn-helix transcriptional regulator [Pirellulaceae bacterium]HMO90950.1 winged helix-turn-helix transcriptional regulator [Pirellulaceae bacterium]HMP69848.1 winged helix-turn-helix transcriptional regulator [Pirellulaceae bacterium]
MNPTLTANEQEILDLLRNEGAMSIDQLIARTGVTATAVRQRLGKVMASGLVERFEVKHGRGRPSHEYRLSKDGYRSVGNNLADLADAMWEELQAIPNQELRRTILTGVASRLAVKYGELISGDNPEERLAEVAKIFGKKNVPFVVEEREGLKVLKIVGCPYPELNNSNKEICELEKKFLSKLIHSDVTVNQTTCGVGTCCTFEPEKT